MKMNVTFSKLNQSFASSFSELNQSFISAFGEVQVISGGKAAVIEPLEVTENGEYTAPDGVDGYSPIVVSVPVPEGYIQPEGTLEVTENGTHDVTTFAFVNVNVQADGGGADDSNYEFYEGSYIVTPSVSNQTLDTANKLMKSDVIIEEIPYAEVGNNSGGKTVTIGK